MKSTLASLALFSSMLAFGIPKASAQLSGSDGFTYSSVPYILDTKKWGQTVGTPNNVLGVSIGTRNVLLFSNSVRNSGGGDYALRPWIANTGTMIADWSIRVKVSLATAVSAVTDGDSVEMGINVSSSTGGDHQLELGLTEIRFGSTTVYGVVAAQYPQEIYETDYSVSSAEEIILTFRAASRTIEAGWLRGGTTNLVKTFSLAGWNLDANTTFRVGLYGFTYHDRSATGSGVKISTAYKYHFDDFSATTGAPLASGPSFESQPQSRTALVGETATFSAEVTSSPNPLLRWQCSTNGGNNWTTMSSDGQFSGVGTKTLTISNVTTNMTGHQFRLVAVNTVTAASVTSAAATLTVNRVAQTITFPAITQKNFGDASFNLPATASSRLSVLYASANPSVATVQGDMVSIVGVGTTVITASQAGDSQYLAAAPVSQALTVNPLANKVPTITLAGVTGSYTAPGSLTLAVNPTDTDGTVSRVEYRLNGNSVGTSTSAPHSYMFAGLAAGAHTLAAVAVDNAGATSAPVTANVTVTNAPTGSLQFNNAIYTAVETAGSATITVTRTGGSAGMATVNYAVTAGTAVAGTDFTPASSTLNWANGDTASKTFTVTVLDDTVVDGSKTVNLSLSGATGAALGSPAAAVLTITDNDVANKVPTIALVGVTGIYTAPGSLTLAVNPADADGTVSRVEYRLNGNNVGTSTGTPHSYTFTGLAAGAHTLSAVAVDNTGATSAPLSASVTITNAPVPAGSLQFSSPTYTVAENAGSATITVTRTGGNGGTASISCAVTAGTATAGVDFTPATKSLNWADGDSANKTFTVTVLDDTAVDGSKSVNLSLSGAVGAALGSPATAVLTITDNDVANQAPSITLVGVTGTYTAPGSLTLAVYPADADGTVNRVEYRLNGNNVGTSTSAPHSYTFAGLTAGAHTFSAVAVDNAGAVSAPVSSSVTITNTPGSAGTLQFSSDIFTESEGAGSATITVTRTGGISGAVSVNYAVTAGLGSVDGRNFIAKTGKLTWENGDSAEKTFKVTLLDNRLKDSMKQVMLDLSDASGATLGSLSHAGLYISDDDGVNRPPTVTLTTSANAVALGQALTLSATADDDGTVTKVEFFAGATKLGEDTTAPYILVVSTLPVGTHTVFAKATDNNGLANTSKSTNVTVNAAGLPILVQVPTACTAAAGTNVTFTVASTNAQSYQWFFGASPIAGATNASLTLTNVQRTATGVYAVVVSNAAGSVTNRDAVLRVMASKRLNAPQSLGNGRFRLTFGHQDGGVAAADDAAKLAVQVSTRLFPPAWVTLTNAVTVTDGQFVIEGTLPSGTATQFFRIVEQ